MFGAYSCSDPCNQSRPETEENRAALSDRKNQTDDEPGGAGTRCLERRVTPVGSSCQLQILKVPTERCIQNTAHQHAPIIVTANVSLTVQARYLAITLWLCSNA